MSISRFIRCLGSAAAVSCVAFSLLPFTVAAAAEPDRYEGDDSSRTAGVIVIDDRSPQEHSFHVHGDEDWTSFVGLAGQAYEIRAENVGPSTDVVIELYDTDGTTRLSNPDPPAFEGDAFGIGHDEYLLWNRFTRDDIYHIRIRPYEPHMAGDDSVYSLLLTRGEAPQLPAAIDGFVSDAGSGLPVARAQVISTEGASALSLPGSGYFLFYAPAGSTSFSVMADGFATSTREVFATEGGVFTEDFSLSRLPDYWPEPRIRGNGATGTAALSAGGTLTVSLGLDGNERVGAPADWWFVHLPPSGEIRYFDIDTFSMEEGLEASLQGELVDFPPVEIVSFSGLAPGLHAFFFGVDLTPDGVLNGPLSYDGVFVEVGAD